MSRNRSWAAPLSYEHILLTGPQKVNSSPEYRKNREMTGKESAQKNTSKGDECTAEQKNSEK